MGINLPAEVVDENLHFGTVRDGLARHWPLRVFTVVDDSMRPALNPGDILIGLRAGRPRRGQLRVFPDPRRSTRWLVKRVGDVFPSVHGTIFEARSDNRSAPTAADSHEFGQVSAAGSYRVLWTIAGPKRDGG